jgi:hypothetical protein
VSSRVAPRVRHATMVGIERVRVSENLMTAATQVHVFMGHDLSYAHCTHGRPIAPVRSETLDILQIKKTQFEFSFEIKVS